MIKIESIQKFLENQQVPYKYSGKDTLFITTYSLPDNIKCNSIIWIKDPKKINDYQFDQFENVLIVTSSIDYLDGGAGNFLVAENSKELFFSIIDYFFAEKIKRNYIGKNSIVETNQIGKDVYIGHNCYISKDTTIGDNVVIKNNVVVEGKVRIGNNTTVSSGAIIGSDGYGYYQDSNGRNVKVPHLGGVIIGNNVEIGANTCIDKGTLGDTIIGENVKIDNLCHIAHNVCIEENVSVIALSMVAGSVKLKENAYIAPSASIINQVTIGKNSIVGIGAVVTKEVKDDVVVASVPAKVIRKLGDK